MSSNRSLEIAINADRIRKVFSNGNIGFEECTFEIPSKSLVAICGPSGCGKSTLLKALIGESRATSGSIDICGYNLNDFNYEYLRTNIGYVPQNDIIHSELTVEQTLMFAGRLRLPNSSTSEIGTKVNEVLDALGVNDIKKSKIGKISGGQKKRVSIAVELLSNPAILFLDEPTSPLDPQSVHKFLRTLQALAHKGTTIVMVTHKPEDLSYMDNVIMLAKGGILAYYGNPNNILSYFEADNVVEVYSKLDKTSIKRWVNQFGNEHSNQSSLNSYSPAIELKRPVYFYFAQYFWLTARYLNVKANDSINLIILLIQAPAIAILLCMIFPNITQVVPFFLALSAIWFGANNAAREIVCERYIYKRERMFNQGIFPYIFSKATILGSIAIIQSAIFTTILHQWFSSDSFTANTYSKFITEMDFVVVWNNPLLTFGWMSVLSIASTFMGLLISALANTTEKVMSIIPLTLIPQILLAGVVVKIDSFFVELLSYLTLSRWGTEGFAKIQKDIVKPNYIAEVSYDNIAHKQRIEVVQSKQDTIGDAMEALTANFHTSFKNNFDRFNTTINIDFYFVIGLALVFFIATWLAIKDRDRYFIRG